MYENVLTACDLSPLSAWRADSSFNSPQSSLCRAAASDLTSAIALPADPEC